VDTKSKSDKVPLAMNEMADRDDEPGAPDLFSSRQKPVGTEDGTCRIIEGPLLPLKEYLKIVV
jgi:hypothetical protein